MSERVFPIFSNSTMGETFAWNYCRRCLNRNEERGDYGCEIMDRECYEATEELYSNGDLDSGCWGIRCKKFEYCRWDLVVDGDDPTPVLTAEKAKEVGQERLP